MKKTLISGVVILILLGAGTFFYINYIHGGGMRIKEGSKVSIDYTLTVDDKEVDTSKGKEPLQYTQGSGMIISGLEEALAGLKKGDHKVVSIPPEKGYGERLDKAIQQVSRDMFKNMGEPKVGMVVSGGEQSGQPFQAMITAVDKKTVTLDLNHPLAGKTLNFDVTVVGIE